MLSSNLNKIIFIFICLFFFESMQIKAQSAAICQGDSAVLRMNCNYLGTLQWQQSSDQVTWSNIIGATLDTIKVIPSGTTYYRAVITNGTCNFVFSDTALITVNLIPSAPFLSVADTCGSSRLTAGSYTGTLLWSTGQNVNPITVNSAGTYTVSQTVNGCISATGSVTATPLFVPSTPTTGTNTPSATQIVWNWNTVADATGYKYNTVNDYSTATDNLANVSYTQTGLTCNTAYTLYVWAYNSCGNSAVTTLTQTASSCCVPPVAPTATAASGISATTFNANWVASAGATTYYLDVATDAGFTSFVAGYNNLNVGNVTTLSVSGLTCGTTYYYRVRAGNCDTSVNSNTITVSTSACAPTFPCAGTVIPIVDVTNPITGKTWMDRNLGASQVATSSIDGLAYGDLYQWGRCSDGHEKRTSSSTITLSPTDTPGHGSFIKTSAWPEDWRSPQNNSLWQGVGGTNNPCPTGYRLPTEAELEAERASWATNNAAGAFGSPLKLTIAGERGFSDAILYNADSYGIYWSSTINATNASNLTFWNAFSGVVISNQVRAHGASVRCIKN